jgi:cellulose synthase/poly-beta-1,6-N-acetylglucosamine synthase-like glycosyltransferase
MPVVELTNTSAPKTSISVIIPARNEAKNIGLCLQTVAQQNYPKDLFEIILIDDHSEDDTVAIANALGITNLHIIDLKDFVKDTKINAYKKKAIEVAIAQAKGELIVCTDADCRVGEDWLPLIAHCYEKTNAKFIAGPVLFDREQSLFQRFQSLDFAGMMLITAGGIEGKYLYMCNGANLAYPKAIFEEVDGFAGVDGLASGDDMLLLQKIVEKYPDGIRYLKTESAVVLTSPMPTLKAFIEQRRRWASKSGAYRGWNTQLQLGLVWLFHLSIVSSLWLLPFYGVDVLWLLLAQIMIKAFADYFLLNAACTFFNRKDLMKIFIPALFLHLWYIVWVGMLGLLPKGYIWKGRQVK